MKSLIEELKTQNKLISESNPMINYETENSPNRAIYTNNEKTIKKLEELLSKEIEFKTQYTVDKTSEEDSKWEGVKEVEAFKDLGYEILKKGVFKKEMYSGRGENNGRTTYVFTVKILK